jgi:hypothetical protein
MSAAAINGVIACGRVKPSDVAICVVLAHRCDRKESPWLVRISTPQLADDLRIGKRGAQRALAGLIERGIVEVVAPALGTIPTLYRLLV